MDNNSLSHTKWNCKYHIVFAPKYRRKVAYGKIKQDMQSFSRPRIKSVVPSAAHSLYQNQTASNTARTAGSGLPADRQPSA